jgi:hypothetical protein
MSTRSLFSFIVLVFLSITVEAAQRTFVSAGNGSDANACTRQAPCRNFGTAMAQTDSGGEVIVLDSGGYGVVTINQSVSIVAPPPALHRSLASLGMTPFSRVAQFARTLN